MSDERTLEAESLVYRMVTSRPIPCKRDEYGDIEKQPVKQLIQKVNEELDELKEAIYKGKGSLIGNPWECYVAEEAADTITAITTLLESIGINEKFRDEAQMRVNEKNRKRGRL